MILAGVVEAGESDPRDTANQIQLCSCTSNTANISDCIIVLNMFMSAKHTVLNFFMLWSVCLSVCLHEYSNICD